MKKRIVKLTLTTILVGVISGCAGVSKGATPIAVNLKKTHKVLHSSKYSISNGSIVSDNGDRVFDEEGDIVGVYNFSHEKSIYLLKIIGKPIYKVKTIDKKVVKVFDANKIIPFSDKDKVIFAVRLKGNKTNIYDNIYLYNGKQFKFINKNIDLSNTYPTGLFALKTVYSCGSYCFINYQEVIDMENGQKIYNKKLPTTYKPDYKPKIIGARNNKVFYIYKVAGGMYATYVIEAYDTKTKQSQVVLAGRVDPEIQILKNDNFVVIKETEPKKYIYLNTLEEIDNISGNFKPITIKVYSSYDTKYGALNLYEYIVNEAHSTSVKPLF